ncbi:TetR/AcrR family transcriptional regulator [Actinomycetospora endophytica]|uniref:TetR/AcrR family transcriptional regulator n=1 Tax=Actinomycetospora endophytica TaxID=2291215 RepID=A0ABS8P643_9PSEU|nr:TetR/AcrR family transcriptional regulator [Actinomycetospora endophytica]MCD2193726.1 TetR/AcrR family transcriptional regulator [Actinomycetospora endophytica]
MSLAPGGATRAALLDAAETCLERFGAEKMLMNDVAREAGFSRPTLYRYFADREALIRGVRSRHSERVARRALRHIARQRTLEDKIVEGLMFLIEHGRAGAHLPANPGTARAIADRVWIPVLGEAGLGDDDHLDEALDWLAHLNLQMAAHVEGHDDTDARVRVRALIRRFVLPAFIAPPPEALPGTPHRLPGRTRSGRGHSGPQSCVSGHRRSFHPP